MTGIAPPRRLCTACRHFDPRGHIGLGAPPGPGCLRPLSDRVSPVTGNPVNRLHASAWAERKHGRTLIRRRQRCGLDGRYFEPRGP